MKTNLLRLLVVLIISSGINQTVLSQCISDETQIDKPFYAMKFDRDSWVLINSSRQNQMQNYLSEDFTLVFWVYP